MGQSNASATPSNGKQSVILAYSGGLDTSVAIKWLQESYGLDVITLTVDVGQQSDIKDAMRRAKLIGASKAWVIDAKAEFLEQYVFPALKANALYEGAYPLSTALARPLMAKKLAELAQRLGATHVAHGCTGKGNDQVRFEASLMALAPHLKIVAPVREWEMTREEEIDYAESHGLPVTVSKASPYSIDDNLWGRSIECGILEDPAAQPPLDVYEWTAAPEQAPDVSEVVSIQFEKGLPWGLNGTKLSSVELVETLNTLAGKHGVGRVDSIENRLVGIKSREVYECPAATVLLKAHLDLESLVLPKDLLHFKRQVEAKYAELVYNGLWYSPLKAALEAFIEHTQDVVTGEVRVKLYKGAATVVGRSSPHSMYDASLATYEKGDVFDQSASKGFIYIWGLPLKVASLAAKGKAEDGGTSVGEGVVGPVPSSTK